MKYDWLMNDTDQGYLQVYRNKYEYDNFGKIDEKVTGFEAQQAISTAENNKLVVGASYRSSHVNAMFQALIMIRLTIKRYLSATNGNSHLDGL